LDYLHPEESYSIQIDGSNPGRKEYMLPWAKVNPGKKNKIKLSNEYLRKM
jgi:hypothetical protein